MDKTSVAGSRGSDLRIVRQRPDDRAFVRRLLLFLFLLVFFAEGHAATCGYADPTSSGKYVNALCFFDLAQYSDAAASSPAGQNFSFDLPTGGTLSFNLRRTNGTAMGGGQPNAPLTAAAIPTWSGAQLGNNRWYAGVPGRPVLYQTANGTTSVLTFSNFVVTDLSGAALPNFDFIAIDGETTTAPRESFSLSTTGSAWQVIDTSGTNIRYTGLGTQNVTWLSPNGNASAPILRTHTPTQVVATMVGQGLQGMAFALAATTLVVEKNVADSNGTGLGRAVPGDQFQMDITNAGGVQFDAQGHAVTTGNAAGRQAEFAQSLIYVDGTVNIAETMAAGSASNLSIYQPKLTCTSTSGVTTGLPTNVSASSYALTTLSPVTFDLIRCVFTNTIPKPQVSIAKSTDTNGPLPGGGTVTYTITVANTGQAVANGVVVRDDMPSGIAAFAWTCAASGGATCPNASGVGSILETVASLPVGGRLVYTVTATLVATPPSEIVNTASANPPGGTCFPDNSAPPCSSTTSNESKPILAIGKIANTQVAVPNQTINYTFVVRNIGTVAAQNVAIDDAIPAGLTNVTWNCVALRLGSSCPNTSGSGAIHETVPLFLPRSQLNYHITATVVGNPPAEIVNTATVSTTSDATCNDGSTPPCASSVTTPTAPILEISKTASPQTPLGSGDTVTYTIVVHNASNGDAAGAIVRDEFPNGIDTATWTCSASGGAVCPHASSGGTVSSPAPMIDETVAVFPAGATLTYTVTATVNPTPDPPPASITNTATVTPPNQGLCLPDASPGPCSATVTNPGVPVVAISKTTSANLLVPGESVTYTVTASNTGNVAAPNTIVADPIPDGLTTPFTWICTASGGAACPNASGSGALLETIATFPAGGQLVYAITATVATDPPATVTNTATITPPPDGVCNGSSSTPCSVVVTLPVAPEIGIDKTGPDLGVPGQSATWSVTVTNTGSTDASGTLVSDPLPPGIDADTATWTCAASGGAQCANASGTGSINEVVPVFPADGEVVYTITATIEANPPATIVNVVNATPPNSGRCREPDATSVTLPPCTAQSVTPTPPIVSIDKTTPYTFAVPGTVVTYNVTVRNAGNAPADGTVIADAIPNGLTMPFTWVCTASGGAVCPNASGSGAIGETIAAFPSGGEVVYAITATVAALPPLSVINTATATPPDEGLCAPDNSAPPCSDRAILLGVPLIGIAKEIPPPPPIIVPGATLTYIVTVTNGSNSFANNVVIDDAIPAGLTTPFTWTCAATGPSTSCPNASGSGAIHETVQIMGPGGQVTYTITATVADSPPDPIVNTASATPEPGPTLPFLCLPNNTPPPCTATVATSPTPIVSISKSANQTILVPGGSVTYTVTARNVGSADADGTLVSDPVANGLTGYEWTCVASGGAACPAPPSGSGALSDVEIPAFPPGGEVVFTINATVAADPPASVVNTATATPPPGGICEGVCDPPVGVPVAPQIGIVKSVQQTQATPGQPLDWTVTVTNTGNADAQGTTIADPLPNGVDAASAVWTCTANGGATCPHANGTGAIEETVDASFPASANLVYALTATVVDTPPMQIVNTATAQPPQFGLCSPGNTSPPCSATTTTPTAPQVSVQKSVVDSSGDGIAQPGEQLIYTILLRNSGGSEATGVSITDELDANTTFLSAAPAAAHADGTLTWTGLTVPSGGQLVLTVVVTVDAQWPAGTTQIANLALETGDPVPDCETAPVPPNCALLPVSPPAVVMIAKRSDTNVATPGGEITYTVEIVNTSEVVAIDVVVSDPLPEGVRSTQWTCSGSGGATCPNPSGSGAIAETVENLPAGGRLSYTIVATLASTLPDPLVNTASITVGGDGSCLPCVASANANPTAVQPPPLLVRLVPLSPWLTAILAALFVLVGVIRARRSVRIWC